MSLLFLEGFDWLDETRTDQATVENQMRRKYGYIAINAYGNSELQPGRFGSGTSLEWYASNGQALYTRNLQDGETETSKGCVTGFAIRTGTTVQTGYLVVVRRAEHWNCNLRTGATGNILVYRGGNAYHADTGFNLRPLSWYYIELKVICKDSPDGEIYIRVNGELIYSDTGIDTLTPWNPAWTGWDNVGVYNCYSTQDQRLDDWYVCNMSGSTNNDFLGDIVVRTRKPNGDASVAMTRSGGTTNYENVDNAPYAADWEDTSYVESGVATTKDLYDYSNLETEDASAAVVGVQIESIVRATAVQKVSAKHKVKSGATEIGKATQNFMWDTYGYMIDIQETDPATGVAWTQTGFDAAQFGIEVA